MKQKKSKYTKYPQKNEWFKLNLSKINLLIHIGKYSPSVIRLFLVLVKLMNKANGLKISVKTLQRNLHVSRQTISGDMRLLKDAKIIHTKQGVYAFGYIIDNYTACKTRFIKSKNTNKLIPVPYRWVRINLKHTRKILNFEKPRKKHVYHKKNNKSYLTQRSYPLATLIFLILIKRMDAKGDCVISMNELRQNLGSKPVYRNHRILLHHTRVIEMKRYFSRKTISIALHFLQKKDILKIYKAGISKGYAINPSYAWKSSYKKMGLSGYKLLKEHPSLAYKLRC